MGTAYVIEIATSMPQGDLTIAQLNDLTAKLDGSGKGAKHFQDAIAQLGGELSAAKAVAGEAAAELAAGNERYNELEKAADRAASAVAKMEGKAEAVAGKLERATETSAGLRAQLADINAAKAAAEMEAAAAAAAGLSDDAAAATARAQDLATQSGALAAKLAMSDKAAAQASRQLAKLQGGLEGARADADAAAGEMTAYAATLGAVEQKSKGAAAEEKRLADALGNVRKMGAHVDKALAGNSEQISKVQGAFGQLGGPVGRLGQTLLSPIKGFADLKQTVGSSNAIMLVGVAGVGLLAAAVVALGVAAAAGVVAIAAWGVGLADAARSAGLAQEAAEQVTPGLAVLRDAFDEIEGATGQNAAALRGWEKTLRDAKVSAGDMPKALKAIALAETALGSGGAQSFIDDLKKGKTSVEALSSTVETKFGGIVARQMLGLDAQGKRFSRNIGELFGGLDIEPVLEGFDRLVGMFDETSATGRFMKAVFEGILQPLIDNADEAATVIEAFAIGFAIGLTKMYIAAKPAIKWIAELFGFEDTSLSDVLTMAKNSGELFAKAFVVAAAVVGGLFVAVTAVVGVVWAINVAFMAAAGAVLYFGVKAVKAVLGFFQDLPGYAQKGWDAIVEFGETVLDAISGIPAAVAGFFSATDWQAIGLVMVDGVVAGLAALYDGLTQPWINGYNAIAGVDWGGLASSIVAGFLDGISALGPAVLGQLQSYLQGWIDLFNVADKWNTIGTDITQGMVKGIISGGAAVLDAIGGIAQGAINRAKEVLGIASPSKAMATVGGQTAEGVQVGIEAGEKDVQQAMAALVEPPEPANDNALSAVGGKPANDVVNASLEAEAGRTQDEATADYLAYSGITAPAQPAPSTAAPSAPSGTGASVRDNTFNFYGVKDAEQAKGEMTQALLDVLEGTAEQATGGSGREAAA